MKHPSPGDLRRMIDEPGAFPQNSLTHARWCPACRARAANVRRDAAFAAGMLADEPLATVRPERLWTGLAGVAAAAALVLAFAFTPLGGYASGFLTIFQPQTFTPLRISRADVRNFRLLPQAGQLGTQRTIEKPIQTRYATFGKAEQHVHFKVRRLTGVPTSLASAQAYEVSTPGRFEFVFSKPKASAYAARHHKALPPMPANLNGTTVRIATGGMLVATYGERRSGRRDAQMEQLVFAQTQTPRVTSTGASLATLESYLLAMPGVSPQFAEQLRALGDISHTVPIPIIIGKQLAQHATVDGSDALAIGDNTGIGAGIVWQKNGIIYAIAGPFTMDRVTAFANGLK
ncbi:MAG: hypothetical protein M3R35_06125 [Candidatus Eremiobacteraeota bacterium]|nr:hypothetical protein [Candidatus Eremiobacteraeota bacterium]